MPGVTPERRKEELEMNRIMTILLVLCFVGITIGDAVGETRDQLKGKFEKRLEKLQEYKGANKVGETNKGYAEALDEKYLKDKDLKKLVDAENADRKKLYKMIAKEQSTAEKKMTIEEVGKQNAIVKFKKAGGSEYFKGKDDKWRTKEEMLKKKK
jgi:uncharacterized protein YdbL (DUF1318 family)